MDRISQNPQQFQQEDAVFRRAHLQKFPYTIYYFFHQTFIYIAAVWPQAARKDGWREA
ncbi:MAG: hypothetical protein AAF927_03720 [Bacteroidota bacterium]